MAQLKIPHDRLSVLVCFMSFDSIFRTPSAVGTQCQKVQNLIFYRFSQPGLIPLPDRKELVNLSRLEFLFYVTTQFTT
jgi:hypothetical protein